MDRFDRMDRLHPQEDRPQLPERLQVLTEINEGAMTDLSLIESQPFCNANDLIFFIQQRQTVLLLAEGVLAYQPRYHDVSEDDALRTWDRCPSPAALTEHRTWEQNPHLEQAQMLPAPRVIGGLTASISQKRHRNWKGNVCDVHFTFADARVPQQEFTRWIIDRLQEQREHYRWEFLRMLLPTDDAEEMLYYSEERDFMHGRFYPDFDAHSMIWPKDRYLALKKRGRTEE